MRLLEAARKSQLAFLVAAELISVDKQSAEVNN